jgi:hypothetical protein
MVHTVCLCKDLSGWFATLSDATLHYPGARVHWAAGFENPDQAMAVLDLAQALAFSLADEELVWPANRAPSWT